MQDLIKEIESLKERVAMLETKSRRLPDVCSLRAKFDDLIEYSCKTLSITKDEFYGDAQLRNIATARHLVSYIAIAHMGMSADDVGKRIKKDRSTVSRSKNEYQGFLEMKRPTETMYYDAVINSLIR